MTGNKLITLDKNVCQQGKFRETPSDTLMPPDCLQLHIDLLLSSNSRKKCKWRVRRKRVFQQRAENVHNNNSLHYTKKSFPLRISKENETNPQFPAGLVTFTGEILNGKHHFLCSVNNKVRLNDF